MKKKSTFSYEKPEHSPGYLLWKTTVSWQRLIKKALDPFDISHGQFVILAILQWFYENKQNATQMDIVNLSNLDKMTVSKSLRKLVSLELIKREECSYDTRSKVVSLTQSGQQLIKKLTPIVEGIDRQFFARLTEFDQAALINILNQF